jgi:adenosylcobyric acid synthase
MNSILLKPTSDRGSQVVVQGKVWRDLRAQQYYEQHDVLAEKVRGPFERLLDEYEFVVVEGAGSIAELNLAKTDLVNMGLARAFEILVLLVADIDRVGVFDALHGTIDLLSPVEKDLVRAFAVNRFRGDPALFENGRRLLEEKIGKPCLGVFSCEPEIHVDEEDGVALEARCAVAATEPPVAIVRFPRIANFGAFRLLQPEHWIDGRVDRKFHAVILPGTKNTTTDLEWMRSRGLDEWLLRQHSSGARILGICGGYQMLGERIDDPFAAESDRPTMCGLGLLPVTTVMSAKKRTAEVEATTCTSVSFSAYEIHMGQTRCPMGSEPLAWVDGRPEGMRMGRIAGSYLHGALESPDVAEEWLGFRPDPAVSKEESYERLADWFEASADKRLLATLLPGL